MNIIYKSIITGLILLSILKIANAQTNCTPYCQFPNFDINPTANPVSFQTGDSLKGWDPNIIFDTSDSLYKIYYTKYALGVLGIKHAYSSNGINWTAYEPNGEPHVLKPTPGGWDWQGVETVSVLKKDSTYYMWYYGYPCDRPAQDSGRFQCIGLATSTDGLTWTKVGTDAVMKPTEPWEQPTLDTIFNDPNIGDTLTFWEGGVLEPAVIWDESDQLFKMWYEGHTDTSFTKIEFGDTLKVRKPYRRIGYATSIDGIIWNKYSGNPVFTPLSNSPWEASFTVGHTNVLKDPVCGYHLFYESWNNIGHAFSEDGITGWIRNPSNPILLKDISDTNNLFLLGGPSVLLYSDSSLTNVTYRLYFMRTGPNATAWGQNMMISMAEFTLCDTSTLTSTEFIEFQTSNDVHVYPNPFQSKTNIRFNNPKKDSYSIIIYNINGQLIRQIKNITSESIVIKRENLKNGLYFFQITNGQSIITNGKLLVE